LSPSHMCCDIYQTVGQLLLRGYLEARRRASRVQFFSVKLHLTNRQTHGHNKRTPRTCLRQIRSL